MEKQRSQQAPIAVIGLACRFPDAPTPEAYWELVSNGRNAVTDLPADRWEMEPFLDPTPGAPAGMYVQKAGCLENLADFDAHFFDYSPREARSMDPQQRLMLECAWEAVEHAGYAPDGMKRSRTGVYVGLGAAEYLARFYNMPHLANTTTDIFLAPGNDCSFSSGRISFKLGLQGPNLALNTACSASLLTVHLGCQALRNDEADMCIAGGANVLLSEEGYMLLCSLRVLSPDGECRTFGDNANGYVRGEGVGMVALKRLDDAVADNDTILAVIRGSVVNHDGLGDGMMAPNPDAQITLIEECMARAGVTPQDVDFIEAHGTGTVVGDPIEMNALGEIFASRSVDDPLYVASVKTNIGHLEQASGIAGFIKAVQCVQHARIPRHRNVTTLNPAIKPNIPVKVALEHMDWPDRGPRVAGVSAFALSGTNAHIILGEAPPRTRPTATETRPVHLIKLSGKTDTAVEDLARAYARVIGTEPLQDIAYTTTVGRSNHRIRATVIASSDAEARERLTALSKGEQPFGVVRGEAPEKRRARIAFVFTGQGSQYTGMAKSLYEHQPVFRAMLDRCDAALRGELEVPLLDVVFGRVEGDLVHQTAYTQPALYAVELGLAALWGSLGVRPDVVLGHSIGEIAAATVSGVMSVEDGVRLVAARGRLMQALPQDGAMHAFFTSEEVVAAAIAPHAAEVSIAALNGPTSTVISGKREAVQAVQAALEAKGIDGRPLTVSHAFHSPCMDPILDTFEAVVAGLSLSKPEIPLIANVSGQLETDRLTTARYWRDHIRGAVRFLPSMQALAAEKPDIIIEIGPQPVLTKLGKRCVPDLETTWVSSLQKQGDWEIFGEAVGNAWSAGAPVEWTGWEGPYGGQRVQIPTYTFQRVRHWLEKFHPPRPRSTGTRHYRIDWKEIAEHDRTGDTVPEGAYLVMADRGGHAESICAALEARGHSCLRVFAGDSNKAVPKGFEIDPTDAAAYDHLVTSILPAIGKPCRGLLHFWALDTTDALTATGEQIAKDQHLSATSALYLLQAAQRAKLPGRQLWLMTRGAQPVARNEKDLAISQTGLWGLGRVIALEAPEIHCKRVDLDPTAAPGEHTLVVDFIAAPNTEDQVGYRKGKAYGARLADHVPGGTAFFAHKDGAYIITGGLGGLGLEVAKWLVRKGAQELVLLGRSAPKPAAASAIAEMTAHGAKVRTEQVDVSIASQVDGLFARLKADGTRICGVFHAAGVLADAPLMRQDADKLDHVMGPKVLGTYNLHKATESLDLDTFAMFSSVTSAIGAPGQANYAVANAYMDALAHHRHSLGLPAVSINWGPWAEVGMAAKLVALMNSRGMRGVPPGRGLQALGQCLQDSKPQLLVMDFRLHEILEATPALREAPFLEYLVPLSDQWIDPSTNELRGVPRLSSLAKDMIVAADGRNRAKARKAAKNVVSTQTRQVVEIDFVDELRAKPGSQRAAALTDHLVTRVAKLLDVDRSRVTVDKPLAWQGFDSVLAVDLKRVVDEELDTDFDLHKLASGPRLDELTTDLLKALDWPDAAVPLPTGGHAVSGGSEPVHPVLSLPPAQRSDVLLEHLRGIAADMADVPAARVDPTKPLAWQGFDSLLALQFKQAIDEDLNIDLPLEEVANSPKLTEVVPAVLRLLPETVEAAPAYESYEEETPDGILQELAAMPEGTRAKALQDWLTETAADILDVPTARVDPTKPLAWQGYDSLLGLQLKGTIDEELEITMPIDEVANGPKVEALVELILPRLDLAAVAPKPRPAPRPRPQPTQNTQTAAAPVPVPPEENNMLVITHVMAIGVGMCLAVMMMMLFSTSDPTPTDAPEAAPIDKPVKRKGKK